jgi:hypothetical protein
MTVSLIFPKSSSEIHHICFCPGWHCSERFITESRNSLSFFVVTETFSKLWNVQTVLRKLCFDSWHDEKVEFFYRYERRRFAFAFFLNKNPDYMQMEFDEIAFVCCNILPINCRRRTIFFSYNCSVIIVILLYEFNKTIYYNT